MLAADVKHTANLDIPPKRKVALFVLRFCSIGPLEGPTNTMKPEVLYALSLLFVDPRLASAMRASYAFQFQLPKGDWDLFQSLLSVRWNLETVPAGNFTIKPHRDRLNWRLAKIIGLHLANPEAGRLVVRLIKKSPTVCQRYGLWRFENGPKRAFARAKGDLYIARAVDPDGVFRPILANTAKEAAIIYALGLGDEPIEIEVQQVVSLNEQS